MTALIAFVAQRQRTGLDQGFGLAMISLGATALVLIEGEWLYARGDLLLVGFGSVWLYSAATRTLGAARAAAAASTVPGVVALLAVALLGEDLSWSTAACVGLIMTGAWVATLCARPA